MRSFFRTPSAHRARGAVSRHDSLPLSAVPRASSAFRRSSPRPAANQPLSSLSSPPSRHPYSFRGPPRSFARDFHGVASLQARPKNPPLGETPPTDFEQLDVLADTPVPATAVDAVLSDGFRLNSGMSVMDGNGVLLVGGEAFAWRPWVAKGSRTLVNGKGQWEVPAEAFALLELLWPRPDLLILGIGPQMRPISPATRKAISELGMRVEVLDTGNAAAQFNLLATERGVHEVAAALIPIGWKDGVGAS